MFLLQIRLVWCESLLIVIVETGTKHRNRSCKTEIIMLLLPAAYPKKVEWFYFVIRPCLSKACQFSDNIGALFLVILNRYDLK